MKITMYELLGLIKDGKAPKKINFCGNIYEWEDDWYLTKEKNYKVCLGGKKEDRNILITAFNDDVEILEEPKKIEKLKAKYTSQVGKLELANKINELIDEINNLKEED